MARTRQTAHKSTCGPPDPIQHPQEVPEQEEPEQPEDLPKFVVVEDDDDDYYDYYEGGWVDTDTEEEPMKLSEDHLDAAGDSNKDAVGGDGADPGAVGGDNAEDGEGDPAAPDGGDEDQPPPEPHYEKQIHAWTLLKVHSQHFSSGPCRESASH
jgi:hypothetical protein